MSQLGVSWLDGLAVVLSTIGMYVTFLVLIRIVGQRALANMSSFDFAAAIALGAVMGRAVLGYTPTLAAGVIGLVTLFTLQVLFSQIRRVRRIDRLVTNLPLLLLANGHVIEDHLRRAHIVEDELREKLRLGGIHRYDDAAAVILERSGQISILRRDETIARDMLSDVRGHNLLDDAIVDEHAPGGPGRMASPAADASREDDPRRGG